jgi:hypothetical protein
MAVVAVEVEAGGVVVMMTVDVEELGVREV